MLAVVRIEKLLHLKQKEQVEKCQGMNSEKLLEDLIWQGLGSRNDSIMSSK